MIRPGRWRRLQRNAFRGGGGEQFAEIVELRVGRLTHPRGRRRNERVRLLQPLRACRFIAETHQGLLIIREEPPGSYGGYVKETVEKENADRKALMIEAARKQKRKLHELEKEHFDANVKNAFAGEWIEAPDPARPGGFKYVQKQ